MSCYFHSERWLYTSGKQYPKLHPGIRTGFMDRCHVNKGVERKNSNKLLILTLKIKHEKV